jgi:hypothetical protein
MPAIYRERPDNHTCREDLNVPLWNANEMVKNIGVKNEHLGEVPQFDVREVEELLSSVGFQFQLDVILPAADGSGVRAPATVANPTFAARLGNGAETPVWQAQAVSNQ